MDLTPIHMYIYLMDLTPIHMYIFPVLNFLRMLLEDKFCEKISTIWSSHMYSSKMVHQCAWGEPMHCWFTMICHGKRTMHNSRICYCCFMSVECKTSCSQALQFMLTNCSHFSSKGSYYGHIHKCIYSYRPDSGWRD